MANEPSAPAPVPASTRWISWLFAIGSACFAVASIPALGKVVSAGAIGVTYFVGSIFFTSAGALVAVTTWPDGGEAHGGRVASAFRSLDWWAAVIQFFGTLWFNANTFDAMQDNISATEENLRVWTPDFLGSICFLVASYLAYLVVCQRPWCWCRDSRDWWVAALNLLGSVFFMLSAIAAFTLPATDDLLDSSLANSGTLLGAVCFLVGARLLL